MDTKPSEQLDKLTRLAVKICKADIGYISFFDNDRQWLKSNIGMETSEFQLSESICHYLVKNNLTHLTIPDLSQDDTFKEHYAFKENGIRFYAGFPLLSNSNQIIGSFCVLGYSPQTLDELQLEFLQAMAEQTMVLVESQRLSHQLAIATERQEKQVGDSSQAANYYNSIANNSTFYICKTDLKGKLIYCNDFYSRELNVDITTHPETHIFNSITLEYLKAATEAFQAVASGSESKLRVLLKETAKDQNIVTNLWDFIAVKNPANEIVEILCLGYDITELEENRAQIQLLADYTAFQNKKILEYNTFVSHDIRSHVANANGILSLLDIITDENEYRQYFKLLKKEIKETDITIVAMDRMTSANVDFEESKEPVSLYHLIEYVFDLVVRTKPDLVFSYVNKIPENLILFSVREYLENVFLNVISNSLKFTSNEREMKIIVNALQISNTILQITVRDNGKGIDLAKYGDSLFKIQSPLNDIKEAKGIGLYLAKKQIEALGGRVDIESEHEKGTIVSLELLNYEN
nr:GAF domain-containing sensor histidine kinase [Algoriphagus locisalis]